MQRKTKALLGSFCMDKTCETSLYGTISSVKINKLVNVRKMTTKIARRIGMGVFT